MGALFCCLCLEMKINADFFKINQEDVDSVQQNDSAQISLNSQIIGSDWILFSRAICVNPCHL